MLDTSPYFDKKREGFAVRNPLLRACIGHTMRLGDLGSHVPYFHGFRQEKQSAGYIVLCALMYEAFNIHRLPYKADRVIANPCLAAKQELQQWDAFIAENWTQAKAELIELYQHTQNQLNHHFSAEKPLVLKRAVQDRYTPSLYQYWLAAKILGEPFVYLEMDSLNSYSFLTDKGYDYFCVIQYEIDIKDVLYCDDLIQPSTEPYNHSSETEDGEWVVMNRSRDGIVKIPLSAFSFKTHTDTYLSPTQAKNIWQTMTHNPVHFRSEYAITQASRLYPTETPPTKWEQLKQTIQEYCRF